MKYLKIKSIFTPFISLFLLGMIVYCAYCYTQTDNENYVGLMVNLVAALVLYPIFSWRRSLYYIQVSGTEYLIRQNQLMNPDVQKKSERAVVDHIRFGSTTVDAGNAVDILLCMDADKGDLRRFKKKIDSFDQYILKSLELKKRICGIYVYEAIMENADSRYIFSFKNLKGKKMEKV